MRLRAIFVLLMGLILLISLPISVAADSSQEWFFTEKNYSGTPAVDGTFHSCDKIMNKTVPSGPQGIRWIGEIKSADLTAWWYAGDPAGCDVSFGEGDWQVNLWYVNSFLSGTLHAEVYSVQPDGNMERLLAEGTATIGTSLALKSITIDCYDSPEAQTVLNGDRLALRLSYESPYYIDGMLIFYNTESRPSSLGSPETDPGYPLPELSTLALFGGGLACLVGYLALSRRKVHLIEHS